MLLYWIVCKFLDIFISRYSINRIDKFILRVDINFDKKISNNFLKFLVGFLRGW